ncbi:hypothetical protein BU24DRAFT_405435 [Aaosphaeria arxii CBS 175.79]|uniref:RRM domain-containing protein n=1 Tax=Aaosphaeria arxii CBS 175.79 TaxID=1450172 RepID=A0A6A5Y084_9PLEO|nr:uncharacterized protein BU24DRAFT_405435 [Aaosphaeria arxii CBS 175.79]KAF2018669.1 hypothetical protein BU24DRAFT_405435 [Aaosphaeria arxii CBS 175.79]
MSTGKLDQSLDDILKTRRQSSRRGRGSRRPGTGRPAATEAPVGGVQKATRPAKQAKGGAAASIPTAGSGESKIMISNLPLDVEESQLKDYFSSAMNVGRPKRVMMQYGPNGRSLGAATVIFSKADQAAKAVKALDNVRIDNRLLKVEVLVSAANAPAPAPVASLADRVTQAKKDKPKPATATKAAAAGPRGANNKRGRGRGRGGRAPRDKKKTVEELDAEMNDYFPSAEGGNDAMVTNGGAAAPAAGDINMDDETL